MKEFKGKVAVITGGASGIGRGIAERCVREGMQVVLADVSRLDDVETLARKTLHTFGGVHLLFNNAGVAAGGSIWESTQADWEWVIGVNLWGVIHGLRVFVPIMLAQDSEGHIVNTASLAGLSPYFASAPYQVSKYAVIGLSEQLYHSLALRKAKIKTSVLCPSFVNTGLLRSERNRPPELGNEPEMPTNVQLATSASASTARLQQLMTEVGLSPQYVADLVFEAIVAERLYILTHPEYNPELLKHREDMVNGRNPVNWSVR
jgi:NAD(P)-dependent dehydrogenase (short-subunit alcohol dehydrogenase family)